MSTNLLAVGVVGESGTTMAIKAGGSSDEIEFQDSSGTAVATIDPANAQLEIDKIIELTGENGVEIEGVLLKDSILETDTVNEKTADTGVTIDGVLLKDNDVVTVGSIKVRAIATPGHTPGSMSYLVDEAILFCGDAFKLIDDKVYPIKHYTMDTERQKESIRKLAGLDNVCLACTAHRGYTEKFSEAIGSWK